MSSDPHRIRLRAAWDFQPEPSFGSAPRRVDLPATWGADTPDRFQLARRFGHPTHDPARERVGLELADVPGLVAVSLDGQRIVPPSDQLDPWSIPLGDAGVARHVVILEVDLSRTRPDAAWGSIAVVVGPILDGGDAVC